tara:strand:+ start:115 stop:594 length:480 start_codon:yes stop_codon:yes gene_type:complete
MNIKKKDKEILVVLNIIFILGFGFVYLNEKLNNFERIFILFTVFCQAVLIIILLTKKLKKLKDPLHYTIPLSVLLAIFITNKKLLVLALIIFGSIILLWKMNENRCIINDVDSNGKEKTILAASINKVINKYIYDMGDNGFTYFSYVWWGILFGKFILA